MERAKRRRLERVMLTACGDEISKCSLRRVEELSG